MTPEPSVWVEVPFQVQKPHHGLRVDSYLAARLHRYSRSQVQRLISSGRVSLDRHGIKPSTRVRDGETVVIRYPRHREPPCPHAELPVLFDDKTLLAVDKPAGLICHPTDKIHNNTATSILKRQFPGQRLHLAHRLDRETSGVLILAKDPKTACALAGQFAGRQVRKEYLALAAGRVLWKRKTGSESLGREGLEIKVRQAVGRGSPAQTQFQTLASCARFSLVKASPKTGRLHQIRVHLAHLGHPVLGDKLYTGQGEIYMKAVRKTLDPRDLEHLGAARQMLHAWRLRLTHPTLGIPIDIKAPLPDDFRGLLESAGLELP